MIKKDYLEKAITYIMIILIVGIPGIKFVSYVLYYAKIINNLYAFNQVYLLWVSVPFLIIIYLIGMFTKKYKFDYADYFMYFLIVFAIISTVFAINQETAIFGREYRNEGLLSILAYYFIFLNVKNINNIKYKKLIINVFLATAAFQAIYAILQVYTKLSFVKHYSKGYMAPALVGNPNFFGSYIVMPLMISIVSYINSKKIKHLLLTVLFFIGLCLANSTGPFLSAVLAFIFLIIFFGKKEHFIKIIIVTLTLIGTFYITDYTVKLKYTTSVNINYNIKDEIDNILTKKDTQGTNVDSRLTVWKKSIPLMKKYWVIGAGLDNFADAYPQDNGVLFDKAHNIYIQMAVTNGMIVLSIYCLICLIAFIKGFKFRNTFYIGLYMAFVVYSIQGFGNINVIDVTPYFYIILALLCSKNSEQKEIN